MKATEREDSHGRHAINMALLTAVAAASGTSLLLFVVIISTLGGCLGRLQSITQHGNNGSFLSPNYPSDYPNDLDLAYIAHLDTPGPQQVRLDYVVDTESCLDHVWLPEVPEQLCGNITGTLYLSMEGNEFNFTFHTDGSATSSGFNITYSVLQGNCHATVDLTRETKAFELLPITDIMTRDNVVFFARSCKPLWISLNYSPTPHDGRRTRVNIGVYDQDNDVFVSRLTTYGQSTGTAVEEVTMDDPLDCCQFRPFWIQWTTTSMAVGTGWVPGSNTILNDTSGNFNVRFIFVYSRVQHLQLIFEAPFPDSYCESPLDLTPPKHCPAMPTESVNTGGVDDVISTSQGAPDDTSTGQADLVSTSADTRANQHLTTVDGDLKTTTGHETGTSDREFTATADDVITTANEVGQTNQHITTSSDLIITTGNGIRTADQHVTSTAEDVAVTTRNKIGTTLPPAHTVPSRPNLNRQQCWCRCVQQPPPVQIHNDTQIASQAMQAEEKKKKELKAKLAKEIEEKLKVPSEDTSSKARRYVSAGDERPSSMYMAVAVGVVCFLPLVVIVLLDVIGLLQGVIPLDLSQGF